MAVAATVVAAQDSAELTLCEEADCAGCIDYTVQFGECIDADLAGLVFRCTPDLKAVELDIILDTLCTGTPVYSEKFPVGQCTNLNLSIIEFSFEVSECTNTSTTPLKLLF